MFIAIVLTVVMMIAIVTNYNLIYATINDTTPWKITRNSNRSFFQTYAALKWGHFVLAVGLLFVLSMFYASQENLFTSWMIDVYLMTRIPAWFVLVKQAKQADAHPAAMDDGVDGVKSCGSTTS